MSRRYCSSDSPKGSSRRFKIFQILNPSGDRVQIPVVSQNGSIAQLGEHLPYKQGVTGSSPVTSTIIFLIFGYFNYGLVVQLVRMPPCHGGGRGFESHLSRHLDFNRDPMC